MTDTEMQRIKAICDVAGVDDIGKLIDELRHLQIYTLYEGADQKLVDLDEVVKIFAGHIKAERRTDENPDIS